MKYEAKEKKFGLGADFRCIKSNASLGLDVTYDASDAKPENFYGLPLVV